MEKSAFIIPQVLYKKHLSELGGIKFTPREINLIACFISGRSAKTIAAYFEISPKTVEAHARNIMLKIGCNSKEGVISFVEKSGKYKYVKDYYANLLTDIAFRKILEEIKNALPQSQTTILFYKGDDSSLYLKKLKEDVALLGEKVSLKKLIRKSSSQNQLSVDVVEEGIIIEGEIYPYYEGVFEALKKLFPEFPLSSFLEKFQHAAENLDVISHEYQEEVVGKSLPTKAGKVRYALLVALAFLITTGAFSFFNSFKENKVSIRSDLLVPHEAALLKRSKLLATMKDKLEDQKYIRSIALVGIGGAGKTTLARLFAKQQKGSVVWELNAESHGSLFESFELLAYKLCVSEEEKKQLKELQLITKPKEREDKIILFVRDHLKLHADWWIIFDNVEQFNEIHKFFPADEKTWGKGTVLVTTRDGTIHNNKYIKAVIELKGLTFKQKYELFSKILGLQSYQSLDQSKKREVENFLKEVPPFPLDVSIAAYYLKESGMSYKGYLKKIKDNPEGFNTLQQEILKESGEYLTPRYHIISAALDKLIVAHDSYKDLLLFISFLDSQNIPRSMLLELADEETIDDFIHHLKKYSLITSETPSPIGPVFSLHRSTQSISLSYLERLLNLNKDHPALEKITKALRTYISTAISQQDFLKMRMLIGHYKAVLGNNRLLPKSLEGGLAGDLGGVYFYVGHYSEAISSLNNSLKIFGTGHAENKEEQQKTLRFLGNAYRDLGHYKDSLACLNSTRPRQPEKKNTDLAGDPWLDVHLGILYRELGDYEKSKDFLESGYEAYKSHLPTCHLETARACSLLGITNRELGKYEKAKSLLQTSLKCYLQNNPIREAFVYIHLGMLHYALEDFAIAKQQVEKGVQGFEKYLPKNHIEYVRGLRYLGSIYSKMKNYEEGIALIERSLESYKKYFPNNTQEITRTLLALGEAYSDSGQFSKAESVFGQAKANCFEVFGEESIEMARVLNAIGRMHFQTNQLKSAEENLMASLAIFTGKDHPEQYKALDNLHDVFNRRAVGFAEKKDLNQSESCKVKASGYLKQAQNILLKKCSKTSPVMIRLNAKDSR